MCCSPDLILIPPRWLSENWKLRRRAFATLQRVSISIGRAKRLSRVPWRRSNLKLSILSLKNSCCRRVRSAITSQDATDVENARLIVRWATFCSTIFAVLSGAQTAPCVWRAIIRVPFMRSTMARAQKTKGNIFALCDDYFSRLVMSSILSAAD